MPGVPVLGASPLHHVPPHADTDAEAACRSCVQRRAAGSVFAFAMTQRFHFADAYWFRVPMKVLVLTVLVFGLLAVYPALTDGTPAEYERALFGLLVVLGFAAMATTFSVAMSDSHVELDDEMLRIRFEGFFNASVPLSDIVAVTPIEPQPRWRYRWGLSTNFEDRIACSHGGRFIEIELAHAWTTRLWPRRIAVRRFWLAVRESDRFADELSARIATAPSLRQAA